MTDFKRVRVLDIPVDAIDMNTAIKYVDNLIKNNKKRCYILAVNPEKIIALQKDPSLKYMFEDATLLIPDGIGVVLALRLLHGIRISRVPGADLMENICRESAKKGYKIFIYGAKEEVNKVATESIKKKYKGLQIVGRCNGYIPENRMSELIKKINNSGADILFIALGSPKQEKWIQRYLSELDVKICQGIGGTLDTIAGTTKRAPKSFQRMGLEWFYRLIREPKRIRRQIVLPVFASKVIKEKIRFAFSK